MVWHKAFNGLLTGLLIAGGCPLALAEQVVQSEKDPITVELVTPLDVKTTKYGDTFEAVLKDSVRHQDSILPVGTVFKGQVQAAQQSRTLAMPGYVKLDIQQAVLPSGEQIELAPKMLESEKVMHPDAVTFKKAGKSALPFTLLSAADAIPLKYAAGLSSWQIFPISLAARMALGATLERTQKERNWHERKGHATPTRYGHGLLRGTGLTGVYYVLKPSPNPDLAAGASIPLHLEKEALSTLFKPGQQLGNAPQNAPQATTRVLAKLKAQPEAQK